MNNEVFYTWESAQRKIRDLRDRGVHFTVEIEFDYDVELDCFVIFWED